MKTCTENHRLKKDDLENRENPKLAPKSNQLEYIIVSKTNNTSKVCNKNSSNDFDKSFDSNEKPSFSLSCTLNAKTQCVEEEEIHKSLSMSSHACQMVHGIKELSQLTTMKTQHNKDVLQPISELSSADNTNQQTCAKENESNIKISQESHTAISNECNSNTQATIFNKTNVEEEHFAKSQNEQTLNEHCL